ncbi:MAG: ribosome-associated translation inhibitor RaiA [Candidatus Sumerlaeia bacterium]|nr:ribosome-associated translation inhibitor RaiA [Candidatus Sumerlaeia bacterium]
MQVRITARHMELDPALKVRLEKKLAKLSRYFERIQEVQVIIEQVKFSYQVEILVYSDLFTIQAKEQDTEPLTTFIKALHTIERKLKKEKDKIIKNKKHSRTTIRLQDV